MRTGMAGNVDAPSGCAPVPSRMRGGTYRCNISGTSASTRRSAARMTKRTESKYKINRRLGVNLWGRPKSPINKREYGPGQHGQRRKKPSDFGVQLMAKQKLRGYYGNISEKQFYKYYEEAVRRRGDTSENLIELLERRLDAVVYRMKFAITPFAARQFVSHGHVLVNGRRVNISSYQVRDGDVVEVREKSKQLAMVLDSVQSAERDVPEYIEVDHRAMKGTFARAPKLADVPYPVQMEPNLVVEFYSR
jgi:small subunit ribosomal protein S4